MQLLSEKEGKLLDLLIENPHIGVDQMSSRLDVSMVTVRSDYDTLAEKGYLIRTRGGMLVALHPEILRRQRQNPELKAAIAKAATALIEDGDSIMVEAETTTSLIGPYLLGRRNMKCLQIQLCFCRMHGGTRRHASFLLADFFGPRWNPWWD